MPYRPGLDGLRALAVIAVIAYHLGLLRGGFVGVDVFFALSGWLITSLLIRSTPRTGADLVQWWRTRLTRLTPAVALVVVATFVVFASTPGLTLDGVATMTWWQNWLLVVQGTSYWGSAVSPLRHTWSLSIEEQFYLAWPAIVVGLSMFARRHGLERRQLIGLVAAVLGVSSFVWAAFLAWTTDDLSRVYFGTDTRVGGLLIGCAAAALLPDVSGGALGRRTRATCVALGAVVLVAAAVILEPSLRLTYSGGLLACSVASIGLIVAASSDGAVARALSIRPLRWIGLRSYGLYLWSWPVQLVVERHTAPGPGWAKTALVVGIATALAALSYRLVEQPLRRPRGTWAEPLRRRRVAWVGGVVLLAVTGAFAWHSAEPGAPTVDREESAGLALAAPPTVPVESDPAASTTAAPVADDLGYPVLRSADLRVMIMGDSQAFKAGFMLDPAERPARFASVDTRAILGCGVLAYDHWFHIDPTTKRPKWFPECDELPQAIDLGLQGRPELVIWPLGAFEHWSWERDDVHLASMSPALADTLVDSIVERGSLVTAAGARLAIVPWACPGSTPDPNGEPDDAERRSPEYIRFINDVVARAAQQIPGAIVVAPTDAVCVGGDPTGEPTQAKQDAMSDGVHVDDDGQAWWWSWVAGQIPDR